MPGTQLPLKIQISGRALTGTSSTPTMSRGLADAWTVHVGNGRGADAKINSSLLVLDNPVIFWSYYCLGWANRGNSMKRMSRIMAGAAIVALLGMAASPVLSQIATVDLSKHRGAPGPIVGAGLPVLAVSLGIYWFVRRRRKPN